MQTAGNLAINSGAAVLMANGAKAENIFLAVLGDIAVGNYAHDANLHNDCFADRN